MLYGQGFAVSADKMNVAYVGVDNPLTIVVEGYSCSQVVVSCNNGELKKTSDCKYFFLPEKEGTSDIVVKVKTSTGLKLIGIKKYRVKIIPNLQVAIAGKTSGKIAIEIFKVQKGPSIIFENFNYEYPAIVTQFKFEIIRNNQALYSDKNNGPFFNEAILNQIKNLKAGDKVLITDISVARPPNFCSRRRFNGAEFYLY
jgi:hypothetical protein